MDLTDGKHSVIPPDYEGYLYPIGGQTSRLRVDERAVDERLTQHLVDPSTEVLGDGLRCHVEFAGQLGERTASGDFEVPPFDRQPEGLAL